MKFKLSLLIFLLMGFLQVTQAQNLSNIQNVKVDNLSDQQIEKIQQEAQSRGLSANEVAQLAVQQGMPQSEARKLRNRLNEHPLSNQNGGRSRFNRQRYNTADSSRSNFFDRFFGADSTRDSLRFYQSIDQLKYRTKQDSVSLAKRKLKDRIFGYGLFTNGSSSFQPSLNIPTPKNYQLGAGDELIIDIYGAAEKTYQLEVSPDGMVVINNIGPISVNGLTIDEAKRRLKNRLGNIYSGLNPSNKSRKDTYMQLSLGQIRSIKVSVIGEALQPGTYTLPSLATVFNAISSAGGPTVTGSFRDIDIIRGDSVFSTFDMYDLLINGNQSKNIRLNSQDIIKINPYVNRVEIKGEVKRPGIYEMKKDESLKQLLTYAGGFTGNAYTQRLKIIGSTKREKRINDVSQDHFGDFNLRNGDFINVQKVLDRFKNIVQIKGAVFREGKYELTDTTTVQSLIERADGLRGDAFQNRGLIYREQNDYSLKTLRFDVQKVMDDPAANDIALKKNDIVIISSIFDLREDYFVQVEGAVQDPGKFKFAENMTLQDLIYQANGFLKNASPNRIEVARRVDDQSGKISTSQIAHIYHFSIDRNLKLDPSEADFKLQPFDKVYIRTSPGYAKQREVQVIGQVRYPGTYTLKTKNDRISDLIQRAGGLTQDAYSQGAALYRKIPELQSKASNKQGLYTRKTDSTKTSQSPVKQEEKKETISKIGLKLPEILDNPGSKYDYFLQKKDSVYVPKSLQTVLVKGGVFYPTSVRYDNDLNYKDYITAAGGYNELAKGDKSYIVYANGDVNRIKKFLFFKNYPEVKPGATLVVPERKKLKRLSAQERVAIYSTVVSALAVISTTIFQITR